MHVFRWHSIAPAEDDIGFMCSGSVDLSNRRILPFEVIYSMKGQSSLPALRRDRLR